MNTLEKKDVKNNDNGYSDAMERWVSEKLGEGNTGLKLKPAHHRTSPKPAHWVTFHNVLCVSLVAFLLMGFFIASGYLPNFSSEPVRVVFALVVGWALAKYKRL